MGKVGVAYIQGYTAITGSGAPALGDAANHTPRVRALDTAVDDGSVAAVVEIGNGRYSLEIRAAFSTAQGAGNYEWSVESSGAGTTTAGMISDTIRFTDADVDDVDEATGTTLPAQIIAAVEYQRSAHTAEVYIYVDPVSGNNSNDGSTPALAKLTIANAVAAVAQEHTAIIVLGTTAGQQVISENITLSTRFTFLRGPGLDVQLIGASDASPTVTISADGCEVAGFEVTTLGTGTPDAISVTASFARLRRLRVVNARRHGVNCSGGDRLRVEECIIEGCGAAGAGNGLLLDDTDFALIGQKTIITGNEDDDVLIQPGGGTANDNVLDDCTVTNSTSGFGVTIATGANRTRVTNTSLSGNSTGDISDSGTDTVIQGTPRENYGGVVYVDTSGTPSASAGRSYPVGMLEVPCDNITDAKAIADLNDIATYRVRGPVTLDAAHPDWKWEGLQDGSIIACAGFDVGGGIFERIGISGAIGTSSGSIFLIRAVFLACTGFLGVAEDSAFAGAVGLAAGTSTIARCANIAAGAAIDMVDGTRNVNVHDYSGDIEIRNHVAGSTSLVSVAGGTLTLAVSCTGGTLALAGMLGNSNVTNLGSIVPTVAGQVDEIVEDRLATDHGSGQWDGTDSDWTSGEREQIRSALGVDGTKTTAVSGQLQDMQGATFNSATDSLEAIRNQGDAAWLTATGFSTHSAADAADAVWDEDLADHVAVGTTGRAQLLQAYNDGHAIAVHFDSGAANTNTVPGEDGTPDNPVSSEAAMLSLNTALGGINKVNVRGGTLTLTQAYTDWGFYSFTSNGAVGIVAVGGQIISSCRFDRLIVSGDFGVGTLFADLYECFTLSITNYTGTMTNTRVASMTARSGTRLHGCRAAELHSSATTITAATGALQMFVHNFTGHLEVAGVTSVVQAVELYMQAGSELTLAASNTAGHFVVVGACKFTDSTTGTATVDSDGLQKEVIADWLETSGPNPHGTGAWTGSVLTSQQIRDAMKLAPTGGAPAGGSVDEHLDDILADTAAMQPTIATNLDVQLSTKGAGDWDSVATGFAVAGDAMALTPAERTTLAGVIDAALIVANPKPWTTGAGASPSVVAAAVWAHDLTTTHDGITDRDEAGGALLWAKILDTHRQELDTSTDRLNIYDAAGTSIIAFAPYADAGGGTIVALTGAPARRTAAFS